MTRDFDGAGRAAPFKESFDGGEPLERRLPAQLDHRQREDTAPKRSREGADGFPGQENRQPDLGVRGPDLGVARPDLGGSWPVGWGEWMDPLLLPCSLASHWRLR